MKKEKKTKLLLALSTAMILGLSACSGGGDTSSSSSEAASSSSSEVSSSEVSSESSSEYSSSESSSSSSSSSESSSSSSSVAPVVTQYLKIVSQPTTTVFTVGNPLSYAGLSVKKITSTDGVDDDGVTMSNEALSFSVAEGTVYNEPQESLEVVVSDANDSSVQSASFMLTVKDRESYAVIFVAYDGTTVLDSQSLKENTTGVTYNGTASLDREADENYGYIFEGWYVLGDADKTLVDLSTYVVTGAVTFVAKYSEYSVSDSDGTLDYAYSSTYEGYLVTGLNDNATTTDIVVPETFNNLQVVGIADQAFSGSTITSLSLPEGLLYIGYRAFYNCDELVGTVTIPGSVTELGEDTFRGSGAIEALVIVGTNLKTIPEYAFYLGSSSKPTCSSLTIGEGVETIELNAFVGLAIESLTLPDSVTTLAGTSSGTTVNTAFSQCPALTTLTYGKGMTADAVEAGRLANKLASLSAYTVAEDHPYLTAEDGILFNKDKTTLLAYPASKEGDTTTSYTIPDSVTKVGECAFFADSSHVNLGTITFGAGVKELGKQAFYQRKSLTKVFNDALEVIGDYCFQNNDMGNGYTGETYSSHQLYYFTMPDSVTTIGDSAFASNTYLQKFTFGANMANFGVDMFKSCSRLTDISFSENSNLVFSEDNAFVYSADGTKLVYRNSSVTVTEYVMPDTVTEVADSVLESATKITSLTLSKNLVKIGSRAFYGMSGVTSALTLPDTVTYIGDAAFSGMSKVTGINVPANVTYIGSQAFNGMKLAEFPETGITIPADCTVGEQAFYNCALLTSATVLNSSLAENEFYGCAALTSVSLNDAITAIPTGAFRGCSSLTTLNIPTGLVSIGTNAFYGDTALTADLVLPETVTTLADNALASSGFANVTIPASVTSMGDNLFNTASVETVTFNNSFTALPDSTFFKATKVTSVTFPEAMTSIGTSAFEGATSLASMSLPETVTQLGAEAFSGCTALTSFSAPGVTVVGSSLFYGCSSLASVTLGTLTSMGHSLFYNCSKLAEYNFDYVGELGGSAFYGNKALTSFTLGEGKTLSSVGSQFKGCSALTEATLNSSVTEIPSSLFEDCTSLTSVTGMGTITSVGSNAFADCSSLTAVPFAMDSVTKFSNYAFQGCTSLTEAVLPSNEAVTSTGNYVYDGCTSVTSVTLPSNITTIGTYAFRSTAVTEMTFGANITSIGNYSFNGCASLATITIENLTSSLFAATGYRYGAFYSAGVTTINVPNSTLTEAKSFLTQAKTGITTSVTIVASDGSETLTLASK